MNTKCSGRYDLEERTYAFAWRAVRFVRRLPKDIASVELAKQLVRAAGSVGANYIEANEALSRKDFIYRIKICRKEAKESRYWLRLLEPPGRASEAERRVLAQEAAELTRIFGAILKKTGHPARPTANAAAKPFSI